MRKIDKIIVHCSVSEWGNVDVVRKWHLERNFSDIGYHFLITNGYPTYNSYKKKKKVKKYIDLIQIGRDIRKMGAHAKGDNKNSIGVCMIGVKDFNFKPLYVLLHTLVDKYEIPVSNVLGHYEVKSGISQGKTCPNFDMDKIREYLVFLLLDSIGD